MEGEENIEVSRLIFLFVFLLRVPSVMPWGKMYSSPGTFVLDVVPFSLTNFFLVHKSF